MVKTFPLTLDEVCLLLYIDDGFLTLNTRWEAILETKIMYEHRPNTSIKHSMLNYLYITIPSVHRDGSFNSLAHVANSLGYDNNFDYDKWNNNFRKNLFPFSSLPNNSTSIFSSPPKSLPPPSPPPAPPPTTPFLAHLTCEFRFLNIPLTSTFREIKTVYRKLARI